MEKESLKVSLRKNTGKSDSKRTRSEGNIPVVMYGHGTKNVFGVISQKDARIFEKHKGKSVYYELESQDAELKGKRVIVKEVVVHPTNDIPMHIDLYEISDKGKLKVKLPIKLKGKEAITKKGGILEWEKREILIKGMPEDIPDFIEVDASALNIGESIHLADIKLPDKVSLVESGSIAVAAAVPPKQVVELTAEEKAAKLEESLADKDKDKAKQPAKETSKGK